MNASSGLIFVLGGKRWRKSTRGGYIPRFERNVEKGKASRGKWEGVRHQLRPCGRRADCEGILQWYITPLDVLPLLETCKWQRSTMPWGGRESERR